MALMLRTNYLKPLLKMVINAEAGGNQYINSINAINAAVYGDTICINSGNYNGFAVTKDNITIKALEVTITS